jgi:translocation and assembly module TamB
LTLGLERLRADVRLTNDAVNATFEVNAKTLSGRAQLTLNSLARDAVLRADGRFDVASLDVLNPLIGTHALLRGKARADLKAAGTLAAPQLNGTLAASELGITAPQYGVRLHDGALRAELNDKALTVSEFAIRGDEGTLAATGSMDRSGGEARVAWRADHLSVLNRPDMRLKVDGSGTAALANKKLVLRGTLAVDEGRLALDTPRVSKLDNDIVIVGRPRPASQADTRSPLQSDLLDVDVALDAGSKLYISGAGLNTYLGGKLNLKTNSRGILEAHGVLSSVRGVFTAFGQRLEIERGRLLFNGAMDNPGLDIVATRKNLAVEAGVEVTGTVRVPNVQLRSNPPVSDGEKLAWITLGHGLDDVSGADLSLLQAAASALVLKNDSVSMTQRIAKQLGLDELSLKGGGEVGSQVAAVGKRLSDKIYLEYQQGMAATSAAVRLSYTLTQSLSLRLNAGVTSGIGLSFSRSYK